MVQAEILKIMEVMLPFHLQVLNNVIVLTDQKF